MILLWYWVCLCFLFIYLVLKVTVSVFSLASDLLRNGQPRVEVKRSDYRMIWAGRENYCHSIPLTYCIPVWTLLANVQSLILYLLFFGTVCVGGEQASFCLKCASLDICSCIKAISRRYSVQQHLLMAHCLNIKLARYKIKILVIPPTSAALVIDWEKPHSWQQVKRDERILLWSNDASRSPVWKEDGTVMIETSVTDPVHAAAACREVLCTCERIEDGNGSQRHHYILLIIIQ